MAGHDDLNGLRRLGRKMATCACCGRSVDLGRAWFIVAMDDDGHIIDDSDDFFCSKSCAEAAKGTRSGTVEQLR